MFCNSLKQSPLVFMSLTTYFKTHSETEQFFYKYHDYSAE